MARVLVLNPSRKSVHIAECEELDDYYRELGCSVFDIARRRIRGKYFDIFCDDEGLLSESPVVSAIDEDNRPVLVGNLIFANHDEQGNTTSITDEDIKLIYKSLCLYVEVNGTSGLAVRCEY